LDNQHDTFPSKNRIDQLTLDQFQYDLPPEKIAQQPLKKRSDSKLLVYKDGSIYHDQFLNIDRLLPTNSLLFFNDTRVIPARLIFQKSTGAQIEIFLLHPEFPHSDINLAMRVTESCTWTCMVGNLKKWKDDQVLEKTFFFDGKEISLIAKIDDRKRQSIKFSWTPVNVNFVDCISAFGQTPLPPYINRDATGEDAGRYQTVYSSHEGAVAAPTAGLHFNEEILARLKNQGHLLNYLTLHVGAGTFQPVKAKQIINHDMHGEQILIRKENLDAMLAHEGPIIAVGTTSMRTLESIYWLAVKCMNCISTLEVIEKLLPYQSSSLVLPSKKEAVEVLLNHLEKQNLSAISVTTSIMIVPGYQFKICDGLITNFHMPGSTLMMLVAAFVGEDWKEIYHEANKNDYRFLSYGDSSLLLPKNKS
jgi:S-adenosylmethionine:tRNA ribosyltransferase-isomerase